MKIDVVLNVPGTTPLRKLVPASIKQTFYHYPGNMHGLVLERWQFFI